MEIAGVRVKSIVILTAIVLVGFGLYLSSLYSYLLFHSLVELFSIIVACGIFIVAWNARRFLDNNYLLFIGIAIIVVIGLSVGGCQAKPEKYTRPVEKVTIAAYLGEVSL